MLLAAFGSSLTALCTAHISAACNFTQILFSLPPSHSFASSCCFTTSANSSHYLSNPSCINIPSTTAVIFSVILLALVVSVHFVNLLTPLIPCCVFFQELILLKTGLVTLPKLFNGHDICKCENQAGEACSDCGLGHSDWCMKPARQESVDIVVLTL
jgi:hypothetical protein